MIKRFNFDPKQIFLPFLQWLPELKSGQVLRADIMAGLTVALVLVPQSMAYAQLAGLPAYYGLYAAFLPPMVASLFGSSRQLATGPVAVVSLLTAAALEPIATAGGDSYIAYAIMLALMVGVFQFSLGILRLGVLINFLSHPVVIGFTNAAAIIIATSQLSKIFGVDVEKAAHHYDTVWNTIVAAATGTHLPTLIMAIIAFTVMIVLRRLYPKWPNVLIAVALTIFISWMIGFEQVRTTKLDQVANNTVIQLVKERFGGKIKTGKLIKQITAAEKKLAETKEKYGELGARTLLVQQTVERLKFRLSQRNKLAKADFLSLKRLELVFVPDRDNRSGKYYLKDHTPKNATVEDNIWRITKISKDSVLTLSAGGRVVGTIPGGLPSFKIPTLDFSIIFQLMVNAVAIALIGFMEAFSIAKAMAARTRQRLDANQELIGQGIGNVVGSFFQSYAISGSFSRSAVNFSAGGITGFSSVITSVVVIITLLWLTPLLYHLPQATLAAVIMMAVIGLINVKSIKHAWRVQRLDGIVALSTFILTLAFAPHLENAIMIGVILSLIFYLYRTMRPRIAILSRHHDGALRDAKVYGLGNCESINIVRFDGSLYFANTNYFEDKILEIAADNPELKFIIVYAEGINDIDATGEEMLAELVERLHQTGVEVFFTRMKLQVMNRLRNSGFVEKVGKERFFRRTEFALDHAWKELGEDHEVECPLNIVCAVKSQKGGAPEPSGAF